MPAIYMVGSGTIVAKGTSDRVQEILNNAQTGWASVDVSYKQSNGLGASFDVRLKDKVSGIFEIEKIDSETVKLNFSGAAKALVDRDSIDYVVGENATKIEFSISGILPTSVSFDDVKFSLKKPK